MNTTGRHPHSRPLPGPPADVDAELDYFGGRNERRDAIARPNEDPGYDDLMREVEAAVMGTHTTSTSGRSPTMQNHLDESDSPRPLFSAGSGLDSTSHNNYGHTNGHLNAPQQTDLGTHSEGSDAEAEAGLAALQMADAQDALDEARRQSGADSFAGSHHARESLRHGPVSGEELSSDSDVPVDINSYGGGFPVHVHYGDQPFSHPSSQESYAEQDYGRRHAMAGHETSSDDLHAYRGMYDYPIPEDQELYPFPPTLGARVDTGGTGGLSEPGAHPRRLSFEDGDEATLAESEEAQTSATQSPSAEGMPDMYFHPNSGSGRPLPVAPGGIAAKNRLPQLMPAGSYPNPSAQTSYDQYGRPFYPTAPDAYNQLLSPSGTPVPRSSSLVSHSSTPQTIPPIRSKTDADRARLLKQQQQLSSVRTASIYGSEFGGPDSSIPQSAELLGLPEIPAGKRKKFNPAKLSTNDFRKCSEPWALSSIIAWIREMSEGETDLKEHAIVDGIVALFTHKVPTMNVADGEALGAKVVKAMFDGGALVKEEEWVKFGADSMTGVLFQLTGTGCYSPRVHTQTLPGRCYAHHCMRTLKKINLQTQVLEPQRKVEDWATFYKLKKEDLDNINKKEIERQNNLHEIVTTEDLFMDQLNVLRTLYRDELAKWQPPIIAPKRREGFLQDVFGKVDAIKQVNEDHLLAQLKYRQHEQGPMIVGFSDIFREWIRKAKNAYVDYAGSFPNASFLIRQEAERNMLFRQFLDQTRDNERSKRLGWDTYLKAPITRLQRYSLLLATVHKHMTLESEEKTNLAAAIDEIRAVTLECDGKVADMAKSVSLSELASKLQLRPGMEKVHLNLKHLGREVIFQGDLQRTGSNKFSWLETHAILFDHYLVLAKTISQRDAAGGLKYEKYDVSKLPIPMDLLVLESTDDDPVQKSSLKGIGAVGAVTTKVPTGRPLVTNQSGSAGPGTLTHTNTASSVASVGTTASGKGFVPATTLDSPSDSEKVMFPFRVKHLGKSDVYTLYAPTAQNRQEWCEKIIEAKTRHAASLFRQNAEPFRLRVIADTAFAYDTMSGTPTPIVIKGTPLDRAIREVGNMFAGSPSRPPPKCRASVNCATAFNQPMGNPMLAIGTDNGVYITQYNNPRGWTRANAAATRVTQIAVLEEFSVFLLISDKSLIAYHLDTVCPPSFPSMPAQSGSSQRHAPQKLSGNRDVGFFATGRMKDRTLVFYKKREGISSTFKILEPVYHKSNQSNSNSRSGRLLGLRKGTTDFFRDFDDFYIPSETYAINLFHTSIAISTARGVEVMTLDKKVPLSIPDLKAPDCASIAVRLRDQRPLGMFRVSDSEFLLCFDEVGIYVDKLGDVSRAVVLEFVGKARQAVLWGGMYLVLVDQGGGFVEVRNAVNGRLKQVISGRDVRLLDDGVAGTAGQQQGTVKIAMQHPEQEGRQLVVEMLVNEGIRE